MNIGDDFRSAFEEMTEVMGDTILIYKDWGTPLQLVSEVRGMKNSEKHRRDKVMFQFLEPLEIEIGDILQLKGARDLWRVTDTQDDVHDGVYVHFEARVEKFSGRPVEVKPTPSHVVVHGSVYGGIQVHSPHATQSNSVQPLQVDENIRKLRELLKEAPVSDLDKEEAGLALDRVSQLAQKAKTEEVLSKVKQKLDIVKVAFDVSKDIALIAGPYIGAITHLFS